MNEINFTLTTDLETADSRKEMCDVLFQFMRDHGQSFYDESVTQLEHALQTAHLAKQKTAACEQVTSALLHDIGHFLMDEHSEHGDFLSEDWNHEEVGAEHLNMFFDPKVVEPIRLHVPAKRYLCTVDARYYEGLSRASKRSYELQGGPMSNAEVAEFESNPFYESAVLLRRWDDGAKVEGLKVEDLESYRDEVESCFQVEDN